MKIIDNLFYPIQNCEEVTLLLCKELNIPYTRKVLTESILEHPDYPSLLTVSDVMKNYGIDNLSLRVTEVRNLEKLPQPFIAQVISEKKQEKLFALIYSVTATEIFWYNPEYHKTEKIAFSDFQGKFTGYIQIFRKGLHCGEKDYVIHRRTEKEEYIKDLFHTFSIPILTIFLSVLSFIQKGWSISFFPILYTMLILAGVITGAILLLYEVDQYNPMLRKVCTLGRKTNCNAILHSKGAKIYGIPWSVIGFSYFMGILSTLLSGNIVRPSLLCIASWFNVLALPYIIYSIYYQAQIVRQWCTMCLTVQAILLFLFITSLSGGFLSDYNDLSWNDALPFITNILVTFLASSLLLPVLREAKTGKQNLKEFQRLKHNPQIFDTLLNKQKKIIASPDGLGITLGNPCGKIRIIKVCNPYCSPCAKAHPFIDKLLDNNPEIHLQIIFSTGATAKEDTQLLPVKHLMGIAATNNENIMRQALDDWYLAKEKDYTYFSTKYPLSLSQLQAQFKPAKEMQKWVDDSKIGFTPAFIINGHLLPDIYTVHDLEYFYSI